ncbi:MAG TPA: alpha-galactosidase [Chloroflexi bacterium]|nr:alpha-galactosidase [Chloroflexota bacterium]
MGAESLIPRQRMAVIRYRVGGEPHDLHVAEPDRSVQAHGLRAIWRWQPEGERGIRVWLRINNVGRHPIYLESADVLSAPLPDMGCPLNRVAVYQNGWISWTPTFARRLDDGLYADPGTETYRTMHQPHPQDENTIASEWVTVIGGGGEGMSLLAGFVTMADQLAEIRVRRDGRGLVARCYFDGALLRPGDALSTETLLLRVGPDPLALLEGWAEAAGAEMGARVGTGVGASRPGTDNSPTGWCTWYTYYGENTADDVLANLEAIDRYDLPLEVVLIDDGYQTAIGDWFSLDEDKFPEGMEPVMEAIRAAGRRPGIWTAPFGAAEDSQLLADHPDWFLRDEAGEPVVGWVHWGTTCYALDCTHPEVLAWLGETFRRMRREWGVEFFKVDFIFAAARPGRRHDPTTTRAQALRRGVAAIREAIGDDAFLLGCGAPLGPCVGLVDGMRVGPDVDPNWHPIWRNDLSMPSTENALRNSIARAPFHGRLWLNDPDCLLVRQRGADMDLVLNEMRTLSAVVALLGGLTIDSDDLTAIRPGRLKYLRQALPPTGVAARPVDLFRNELPRLLVLPVEREWGRWWVVGVVNWGDRTTETTVRLADLGLPPGRYHAYHYWRRRYLGVVEGTVTVRRHQPHETAVLIFKPVSEEPDLLTTTFHVCGGMVEVCDLRRATLLQVSGRTSQVELRTLLEKAGRQFGEVLFTVPEGWQPTEARVDGVRRDLRSVAPGVVALGLTLEGRAVVEVRFVKGAGSGK